MALSSSALKQIGSTHLGCIGSNATRGLYISDPFCFVYAASQQSRIKKRYPNHLTSGVPPACKDSVGNFAACFAGAWQVTPQ